MRWVLASRQPPHPRARLFSSFPPHRPSTTSPGRRFSRYTAGWPDLTIRLRLVAPTPNVYAALQTGGIGIGPDALHTSVRTAVLAAHADRPGPASVTPVLRMLLTQPPELLSLAEVPDSSELSQGSHRD